MASPMPTRDLLLLALGLSACRTPDADTPADTGDETDASATKPAPSTDASTSMDSSTSGDVADTSSGEPGVARLRGGVEKGPLIIGSSISASRLDAGGLPTGEVFGGQIESDAGDFDLGEVPTGLYRLEANGFHFDEVRGALGTAPITLRAVAEVGGDTIHINLLTDLSHVRTLALLEDGMAFADARANAEQDLVAALPIGAPGLVLEDAATVVTMLVGDSPAARYLLAVSALLANDALIAADGGPAVDAELQQRMNTLGADLRDDGLLDPSAVSALELPLLQLDPAQVEANLSARLVTLGLPGDVPNLDLVLDQDRDTLINADDNCPTAANPGQEDADGDTIGDVCDLFASGEPETLAELAGWPGDFDLADDTLYFTTGAGDDALWSVPADGGVPDLLRDDIFNPVRVEAAGGYLYFDASPAQQPHRTDLLGQNLIALGQVGAPFDADDDFFYWAGSDLTRRPHDGVDEPIVPLLSGSYAIGLGPDVVAIARMDGIDVVDKDGTNFRTLADHPYWLTSGLAVDDDAVYWLEVDVCELWRAPLDGGDPAAIWTGELEMLSNGGMFCTQGYTRPVLAGDFVYWGGTDVIMRVPREGGAAEQVAAGDPVTWSTGVRLDATHVYWMNRNCDDVGAECDGGSLVRVQTP